MKRPFPVWLAAVAPATLAGHAAAYALCACSTADGRHGWIVPVLDVSLAFLCAALLFCAGESLIEARILAHTPAERSFVPLFWRLAACQTLLFLAMEQIEGAHIDFSGVLAQIAVALIAAYMLSLFARLLTACAAGALAASTYLQRILEPLASFASRCPRLRAYAPTVRFDCPQFQRPPPAAAGSLI